MRADEEERRSDPAAQMGESHVLPEVRVGKLLHSMYFLLLTDKGLHHPSVREVLLSVNGDVGEALLGLHRLSVHARAEYPDDHRQENQGKHRVEGERYTYIYHEVYANGESK